ncbi:universal stress protein [Actinomadura viridis]|uniref:universal stress protein n=1 Tax=Actinomadura viridis TaxID=58110 RepID=UPI003695CEC2
MRYPVVVGIDGSAHAWQGLDWAGEHAELHGLGLRLVHASRVLARDGAFSEEVHRHLEAERTDLLKEARQYALRQRPGLDIETVLRADEPGHALVTESEDASLVAVGARGIGGFEELLFGSVGLHVAAHALCPVLVVPRAASHPSGAPAEIVVGVDGRHSETRLLEWAFQEAALRGARLVAVHAMGGEFGSPHQRMVEDMELSEALAGWAERFPDVPVTPVVADKTPAQALVSASEKAALVVVGAHERHGWMGMALGRVNHAVLHHARCPAVVVPAGAPAHD